MRIRRQTLATGLAAEVVELLFGETALEEATRIDTGRGVTLNEDLIATTDYGGPLTAVVGNENVVGTQFHPEKSQAAGLKILSNFLGWRP